MSVCRYRMFFIGCVLVLLCVAQSGCIEGPSEYDGPNGSGLDIVPEPMNERIAVGERIDVRATLKSDLLVGDYLDVRLIVNNTVWDVRTISVTERGQEILQFTLRFEKEGLYELAIEDVILGEVTVYRPARIILLDFDASCSPAGTSWAWDFNWSLANLGDEPGTILARVILDGNKYPHAKSMTIDPQGTADGNVRWSFSRDDPEQASLWIDGYEEASMGLMPCRATD